MPQCRQSNEGRECLADQLVLALAHLPFGGLHLGHGDVFVQLQPLSDGKFLAEIEFHTALATRGIDARSHLQGGIFQPTCIFHAPHRFIDEQSRRADVAILLSHSRSKLAFCEDE